MEAAIEQSPQHGLERSCKPNEAVRSLQAESAPGLELLEARFFGDVFEPHRHDTYAIGLTLSGVQRFHYRGVERKSLTGDILVLHPDEEHDGGAGDDAQLHYRMLYLPPALLALALSGNGHALPFVREPVLRDAAFRRTLIGSFDRIDGSKVDGLSVDDLLVDIADGLSRHAGLVGAPSRRQPERQVRLARDFIEAHIYRNIHSEELEAETGIDRFALSRAFRAVLRTSPHRYLLMRRLDQARLKMRQGVSLAAVASETGFADQAHFSRHFKKTYGLTPARWLALQKVSRF